MYACSGFADKPCDFQNNRDSIPGHVTIDYKGDVYLCCWMIHPTIGSAVKSRVEDLIEVSKKNKVILALERGGPAEVARHFDLLKAGEEFDYHNYCSLKCAELFERLKELGKL